MNAGQYSEANDINAGISQGTLQLPLHINCQPNNIDL